MKKLVLSLFMALVATLQVLASDNLFISGQITSITNGVSTAVDGQVVNFTYNGTSGTETWSATTGINGFYEISLIGMSVTGPNRLVIVSTPGCNGALLMDTVSNNQGTIDQAVVNFVACETTSNNCEAFFSYTIAENNNQIVIFENESFGAALSSVWSINGVNFSDNESPEYLFAPGTYEVCLHVVSGTMDPIGCEDTYCTSIVIEGEEPAGCEASFNANVSQSNPLRMLYFNTSSTSVSGTTTYTWNLGDGSTASTNNVEHTYDQAGYYTVCLIMQNDVCSDTICEQVYVPGDAPEGYVVAGSIVFNGMAADDAKVKLYTVDVTTGIAELFAQTEVDTLGRYTFLNVPSGAYYIKANLTQFSNYFGQYAPTYYGNVLYWENATLVEVSANGDSYNIALLATENNGGPGTVGGNVDEGPGRLMNPELYSAASGPAANVDVLVTNLAGAAQRWTNSDANGNFTINNLDYGDYLLFADVAGIVSIPVAFTISPETPDATVMFVLGDVITSVSANASSNLVMFPNPASSAVQIKWNNSNAQKLKLISTTGSLIFEQNLSGTQSQLDLSAVAAGAYFLVVEDAQGIRVSTKLLNVTK
jgi:PKD repeat protein